MRVRASPCDTRLVSSSSSPGDRNQMTKSVGCCGGRCHSVTASCGEFQCFFCFFLSFPWSRAGQIYNGARPVASWQIEGFYQLSDETQLVFSPEVCSTPTPFILLRRSLSTLSERGLEAGACHSLSRSLSLPISRRLPKSTAA